MKFSEYVALKEVDYPVAQGVNPPNYPVAQGVNPPVRAGKALDRTLKPMELFNAIQQQKKEMQQYGVVLTPLKVMTGSTTPISHNQQMRLVSGQSLSNEEQQIVKKQQQEMQKLGFVVTPFELYGGGKVKPADAFKF